jgi:signal transduction histidine kinase
MREAIKNSVRHSGCSRIRITLRVSDGEVYGLIEDDGGGFDPGRWASQPPRGGVGLRSMRERAEILSGSLLVDSRPGAGTGVELRVPLDGQSYLRSEGSA